MSEQHISCETLTLHQTHIDNRNLKIKALTLTTDPNGGRITIYNNEEEAVVKIYVDDDGNGQVKSFQPNPRGL